MTRPPTRTYRLRGRTLRIEGAAGVHAADAQRLEPLALIPVRPGDRVLDLGCGSGLYGLAAALLGAKEVTLSDLDRRAVACARANARRNGIRHVRFLVGDFFGPCGGDRFDLILAMLPQAPGPTPFHPARWGGLDGTDHLRRLLREAPAHLAPRGRLFFMLHDLADGRRVREAARAGFTLRTVASTARFFRPKDYDRLQPGLFAYLDSLRRRRKSRFRRSGTGYRFTRRFLVATTRAPSAAARRSRRVPRRP